MAMKRKFIMYAPGNRNYGYCRLHVVHINIDKPVAVLQFKRNRKLYAFAHG